MPKAQHDALEKVAKEKGLKGRAADNFIYGTMANQEKARKAKEQSHKSKK